jgi:hypothetical protein
MAGLNASSFEGRGGIGLRGAGHAELSAERTVRRLTWYLRASARTDRPARESRRIAANRSTFDIGGIGRLPSRPADVPTSSGGSGTHEHRNHLIEAGSELANKVQATPDELDRCDAPYRAGGRLRWAPWPT